jgi:methionine synthase I (cobalamin-dependent)/5,10-methylenetetrahydrofolate reductase
MDRKALLDALQSGVIVGDGGIGTELYHRGVELYVSYDGLNLSRPDLVSAIHRDYVRAGARLIETNTFGANRPRLDQYHLADRLAEINAAGVRLARAEAAGKAFVAGAVGPLPPLALAEQAADRTADEVYNIFAEQITALANAGADALILETFLDLDELKHALRAAKVLTDLPIIAQLTFHHRAVTATGVDIYTALQGLADAGADVVGTNCGRGVSHVLHIVEEFGAQSQALISAFPNAGFPEYVAGRVMYLASPEYMATMAERMVDAGANIVGGCCGTGPREIAAIAERLKDRRPVRRVIRPVPPATAVEPAIRPPRRASFTDRVTEKKIVLVELDPPYGLDYDRVVNGCRLLHGLEVDAVTMGDSPLATLRMSSIAMAGIVHREVGIECIVHVSCRDRNLIALQSDLMGAWALGLRNVLVITGDPAKIGNQPGASSVYDMNSIACIKMIAGLNEGVNLAGASIRRATGFNIGCGFNPNFKNLQFEVNKLKRKVEAGARFALTQLVFDAERFAEGVRLIRDAGIDIPVYPAIYPLLSRRNAEFIHNELPGARLPEPVLDRMGATNPETGAAVGIEIAKELIEQMWSHADGMYIVAPMNKLDPAAELVRHVRSYAPARRGGPG